MNDLMVIEGEYEVTTTSGSVPAVYRTPDSPVAAYLASLSRSSADTMYRSLRTVAMEMTNGSATDPTAFDWTMLRRHHVAAIIARMAGKYAPSTTNTMLAAVKGVLKAAWQMGLMTTDDYYRTVDVPKVKGERTTPGRSVPSGELAALLATCPDTKQGARDAAIIASLYTCGLRRAELVGLNVEDYRRTDDGGRLVVRGKGNKERIVPVVDSAAMTLDDWLGFRGDDDGPLFVADNPRNRGGRLTTTAVYQMLRKRARLAGIPDLSPHDFRRTFVGDLLDAGVDISTVQKLAGHSSVDTTARYDRRDERAKTAAVSRLHVPYQKRRKN